MILQLMFCFFGIYFASPDHISESNNHTADTWHSEYEQARLILEKCLHELRTSLDEFFGQSVNCGPFSNMDIEAFVKEFGNNQSSHPSSLQHLFSSLRNRFVVGIDLLPPFVLFVLEQELVRYEYTYSTQRCSINRPEAFVVIPYPGLVDNRTDNHWHEKGKTINYIEVINPLYPEGGLILSKENQVLGMRLQLPYKDQENNKKIVSTVYFFKQPVKLGKGALVANIISNEIMKVLCDKYQFLLNQDPEITPYLRSFDAIYDKSKRILNHLPFEATIQSCFPEEMISIPKGSASTLLGRWYSNFFSSETIFIAAPYYHMTHDKLDKNDGYKQRRVIGNANFISFNSDTINANL